MIKEKRKPRFDAFAPDDLILWRVNLGQNAINTINDMLNDDNKLLISGNTVGVTFHDLGGTNIRVVVGVPIIEQPVAGSSGQVRARSPSLTVTDIDQRKRLKREKDYKDTVSRGLEANSPSVGSKPKEFFKNQLSHPIFNGRPFENSGPPITLYNDVFVKFLDDFNNVNLVIPSDFLKWTEQLITVATDSYIDEEARNNKIRTIFSKGLGTMLIVEYGEGRQKCKSDGVITSTTINELLTAYMVIFEGKNEIGEGGSDPTIQGAIYYRDYWSQSNADQFRECCCAPSFIIAMAGPWFCVLGAVFLSRVVIQPLTDFVPLTINLRIPDQVMRISRFFFALSTSFHVLQNFYQNLDLSPSDQRYFPYIRQFQPRDTEDGPIHFTYISELLDDYTRAIWKARTDKGHLIVVKFVSRYNSTAHNICASKGYAPKLLYCSDDNDARGLGGLKMIVMEYVNGTSFDQIRKDDMIDTLSRQAILDDVKAAIQLLHDRDLVFADLRAPNIMIVNAGQNAMLIDFDWCGTHNVDSYPPSMNSKIPWPSGADPCALLKKEHDAYWLDKLRGYLNIQPTDRTTSSASTSRSPQKSTSSVSRLRRPPGFR